MSQLEWEELTMADPKHSRPDLTPWASPRQEPVNGIVQPRVEPPPGKPTRHTNKLEHLRSVLRDASKHKHAWPFMKPVDAKELGIPEYHATVKRPMDLKTIDNRLKNIYYYDAAECIKDVRTVFKNCYKFNGTEDDVTLMAQNVENEIFNRLKNGAPKEEIEVDPPKAGKKDKVKSTPGTEQNKRKKNLSETSEMSMESRSGKKMKTPKIAKRKSDSIEPVEDKVFEGRRSSDASVKVSRVQAHIVNNVFPSNQYRFCHKLISDLFGKKFYDFASVFYEPVDAEGLGLSDYRTIIKKPMDMGTIRKKLEKKEYSDPGQFESDFRLMLENCFKYNPVKDDVHQMGKKLEVAFNAKWKELPAPEGNGSAEKPEKLKEPKKEPAPIVPPKLVTPIAPPPLPKIAPKVTETPKIPKAPPPKLVPESQAKPVEEKPKPKFKMTESQQNEASRIDSFIEVITTAETTAAAKIKECSAFKKQLISLKSERTVAIEAGRTPPKLTDDIVTKIRRFESPVVTNAAIAAPIAVADASTAHISSLPMYEFDRDSAQAKVPLSKDRLVELSGRIQRLKEPFLVQVLNIVKRGQSWKEGENSGGECHLVEIDLEVMEPCVAREVSAFCDAIDKITANKENDKKMKIVAKSTPAPPTLKKKKTGLMMSESSDSEKEGSSRKRNAVEESDSSSDEDSDDDYRSQRKKNKKKK